MGIREKIVANDRSRSGLWFSIVVVQKESERETQVGARTNLIWASLTVELMDRKARDATVDVGRSFLTVAEIPPANSSQATCSRSPSIESA